MNVSRWRATLGLVLTAAALTTIAAAVVGRERAAPDVDAEPRRATVTIYGSQGTFGAVDGTLPSGQTVARNPVPGWSFPPGRQAYTSAVAADGTVLIAGIDHNFRFAEQTSPEAVIGAYDPTGNAYATVRLRTSTGRERVFAPDGSPAAPSVSDLEPIAGGSAVAFTARPTYRGQDLASNGHWPVFGVLTKVDGRWRVAEGNQWTGGRLAASHPELGPLACPAGGPGAGDCRGLADMAVLPASGDLVVAQHGGAIAVLRVSGPDRAGRFTAAVRGLYRYPRMADPGTPAPDDRLAVSPRQVQVDPTGAFGFERFAVGLDVPGAATGDAPSVLQEFRYDAATGAIHPVSAPVIPGDEVVHEGRGPRLWGLGAFTYDLRGNLWAARSSGFSGGELAVYVTAGGWTLGGPRCRHRPGAPMDGYVTVASNGRRAWGRACPPDYDLVQAKEFPGSGGLSVDPTTGTVVSVTFGGFVLAVRASGSGDAMTFRFGTVVDLGSKLLPTDGSTYLFHRAGPVDRTGRLWVSAMHGRLETVGARVPQWLYTVDLADLFRPPLTTLSDVAGRTVVVQAEQHATAGTTRRAGTATIDVLPTAYVAPCAGWTGTATCGNDGAPGDGLVLRDDSGFGHLHGVVDYRVRVPDDGRYRLSFRVDTPPPVTAARIRVEVGGRTVTTPVNTGGRWTTVRQVEPVDLPSGVHTVRLSAPPGGGGWVLNWFGLRRA